VCHCHWTGEVVSRQVRTAAHGSAFSFWWQFAVGIICIGQVAFGVVNLSQVGTCIRGLVCVLFCAPCIGHLVVGVFFIGTADSAGWIQFVGWCGPSPTITRICGCPTGVRGVCSVLPIRHFPETYSWCPGEFECATCRVSVATLSRECSLWHWWACGSSG